MKGFALNNRLKSKDAYDIYFCIRNYEGGVSALAAACQPLISHQTAHEGFAHIAAKFRELDHYGPKAVRAFVEESQILAGRSADQWQQDAFGQVDEWVRAMRLR